MDNYLEIERLKECREALGITKQEAAKRIGVSQPAYVRYEAGTRAPSIQVINEIAKVFHTSTDYLIGKTNQKSPDSIVISKNDSPVMFSILEMCSQLDDKQLEQLKEYIGKMAKASSSQNSNKRGGFYWPLFFM